jgi:hypothetical protein
MQEVIEKKKEIKIPKCFICLDTGLVLYKQMTAFGYEAEYAARCTCQKGSEYTYEGKECTKNKSEYRIPLITEIMDPVEKARNNFKEWYERNKNREGFQEALEEIKKRKG